MIDLFSRRVVGWSMQNRQTTDVVLQALLMAVWRRKPKNAVLIHSDQGSQFTSMDWASFLRAHNLEHSMSRRGNCQDNAVAESFFNLLKRERVRRRTYKTRENARRDVFDYIEMFYNPKRKHVRNGMLSPVEFERQQKMKAEGVQKTRGYSNITIPSVHTAHWATDHGHQKLSSGWTEAQSYTNNQNGPLRWG